MTPNERDDKIEICYYMFCLEKKGKPIIIFLTCCMKTFGKMKKHQKKTYGVWELELIRG